MLGEIRRLTRFASQFEDESVKAVIGHSEKAVVTQRQLKQKELNSLMARGREIDNVIEHLYEDNVAGKLSDDRFVKMTKRYDEEQSELAKLIKALKAEICTESDRAISADIFMATVRKYTRARKLTQRMLNELINHIEVYQAEKVGGVHVQKLKIHYNCVGSMEIPDILPLPELDVLIQTRKGVAVSYST